MHLHSHSTYSPLDGYGTPKQNALRSQSLGFDSMCITDHGTISGWVPHFLACKDIGIKPIFGIEAYIVEDHTHKKKAGQNEDTSVQGTPHITILAANSQGLLNLKHLTEESYRNGFFGGKGRVDPNLIVKYQKGLIVTSGCPTGFPTRLINAHTFNDIPDHRCIQKAFEFTKFLSDNIDNFFVEIVAQPGYRPSEVAAPYLFEFAKKLKRQVILTADSHFPTPEDHLAQTCLLRIAANKPFGQPIWKGLEEGLPNYQFICSEEQLIARGIKMYSEGDYKIACDNARNLCEQIENVNLPRGSYPTYSGSSNSPAELRLRSINGLRKRFKDGYIKDSSAASMKKYINRMEYELSVIISRGIADYFLILEESVLEQKRNGSVVICRGSAGGCLVAYILGISETDPIKHDLYFERFYDENREEAPDIDIDTSPKTRDQMFKKLQEKYFIGKLEAQNELTLKSAIIDCARMYKISREKIESAIGSIDESTGIESQEIAQLFETYPQLSLAKKLVGQLRGYGKHAAAAIISNVEIPIAVLDKVDKKTGEIVPVVTMDKYGSEKMGFLKADLLSVAAIGVVESVLKRIGKTPDFLYRLDLDNENVLKEIGKYPAGIFQFDGSVQGIYNQISGHTFEDMTAASALCRPGAFAFVGKYAKREESFSGIVADILNKTYGVVLYQEQVMALARAAGFSWKETHALRKAVSSSSTAKKESVDAVIAAMSKLKDGLGDFATPELLDNIQKHGRYSFGRAHCCTYSLLGYYMAYLKYYHPIEFTEEYINMEIRKDSTDWILIRRLLFDLYRKNLISKAIPIRANQTKPIEINAETKTVSGSFMSIHGSGTKKGMETVAKLMLMSLGGQSNLTKLAMEKISFIYETARKGDKEFGRLLHWFPWMPISSSFHYNSIVKEIETETGYDGGEFHVSASNRCFSPRTINNSRKCTVAGYVTAKVRRQKTLAMPYALVKLLLENSTDGKWEGQIQVEVSAKHYDLYNFVLDSVERGNFVAFTGSYNGRILKAEEVIGINLEKYKIKSDVIDEEEIENGGI